jgi:hypothetical protein
LAKSLKTMVGATGIEPVTPTMSTYPIPSGFRDLGCTKRYLARTHGKGKPAPCVQVVFKSVLT